MKVDVSTPESAVPADLLDERLIHEQGLRGRLDAFRMRASNGDLGAIPVVIGLVIIWIAFGSLNDHFLSSRNLSNLLLDCAAIGTISVGIVLVLLLGEIDLSVGSVSGLSAAILAAGFVGNGWPLLVAILAALAAGTLIGCAYGLLYTRFGVPSFVITLAGLLGFLGLQLWILGDQGSINLPFDSWIVQFSQRQFLSPTTSYIAVALTVGLYAASSFARRRRRASAGLSAAPVNGIVVKAVLLTAVLAVPVWYLNTSRGVGSMFVLFVAIVVVMDFLLRRTRWGRSVFAVGGNVEAARRAGLPVRRIYITVFTLCSTYAVLGGLMVAGRLAAANQGSGAGDINLNAIAAAVIGGTSLFGGRGSAYSALLGIVVIQSISSGLTLLNFDSSVRFMITGAVLLLAVIVDSLSRRSRTAHGQG
ncbi:D-xylose transport system permease protein [Nonomuraea polychroma]|uniref:Xylose transport system permease protein XylH n=1 Tax=Nonomuraea polychroma TaxID=46176 RepID=A0A438ME54_9ACTN|nr:sugar ABC transporter permease [Nonomuraea polychroma]RVX43908.1 D-xylose transport system permease protein [Nonomuraea polychroma]